MKEQTIWTRIVDKINWWIFNASMAMLNLLKWPMEDTHKVLMELMDERHEQVYWHKWSAEHDDQHDMGQMAQAAAYYINSEAVQNHLSIGNGDVVTYPAWPWHEDWYKPNKPRREQLIVAAALLVAEIERLDRADGEKTVCKACGELCAREAHNTGDGWALGFECKNCDEYNDLGWPYDEGIKTTKELEDDGYMIT